MKNIMATSALLLALTACGGKVSNIVSFTNPVSPDVDSGAVIIPSQEHLSFWNSDNAGVNIAIDPSHRKFKHTKLELKANISVEPVIVDGKIFALSTDGYLTSFEENSLKKLWSINIVNNKSKSDYIWGGITYHAGKLFVTNGSRRFDIVDASNGSIIFSKQFPDLIVTKPVIHNNVVILQTMSNQVYMLDLGNNAIVWDHVGNPETIQGGIAINPVIAHDGMVILSYTSGQIALVDLNKRTEIWQMDLSADNTMPEYVPVNLAAEPIVDNKDAYFADNNGKIFKINLETGALVWKKEIDDIRTINNTVNALIMTTNGRQVVALNKANGKVLWTTYLNEKGKARTKWDPINYTSALVVNDLLNIYTSKGELYKIDLIAGRIVNRSNVGTKLGFVTITDKIRLFNSKDIFVSESAPESGGSKLFGKFIKEEKEPQEEEIVDVTDKPKEKSAWSRLIDKFKKTPKDKTTDTAAPTKQKSRWFKTLKLGKKAQNEQTTNTESK